MRLIHLLYSSIVISIFLIVTINCTIIIVEDAKACFRRALAGKRVSSQFIRRTLTCERVEDCQTECAREKRFMCEGFNYRLDPSGRGQGICELIDVPLSQMDIYSSTNRRDEILLFHPDYDYYERDRNACRPTTCKDCQGTGSRGEDNGGGGKPYLPTYNDNRPTTYRPLDYFKPSYGGSASDRFRPPYDTSIDKYRPPQSPPSYENYGSYESRPFRGPAYLDRPSNFDRYNDGYAYQPPPSYDLDRYDTSKMHDRNEYSEISIYDQHSFPPPNTNDYRPQSPPLIHPPSYETTFSVGYRPKRPIPYPESANGYLPVPRDPEPKPLYRKPPPPPYIPYTINQDSPGRYGDSHHSSWSSSNESHESHEHFNHFNFGPKQRPEDNSVLNYSGNKYGGDDNINYEKNKIYYGNLWTRRPGQDDCSVKSSEGFRLHKGVVRYVYNVPTLTECEKMCYSENKFSCVTFSYRYSPMIRDNCLLCDRPIGQLDYYSDIEPDRDYDIYSMSDDRNICHNPGPSSNNRQNPNAQCFFRAIDASRFFKSIVRDSLNARSVGECEMECIKTNKFTCRAFSFRYGPKSANSIIDNCQLSDWPVRDMDKDRHLVYDTSFDIFERASYGHGCEIQPITDEKNKKLCYLGYGSPAKLLPLSIKKVISVPSEADCKHECIRYRETTPFKCLSFSFGSQASSFNCEMSDLDQTELKLDVDFAHSPDRDYWLFSWNPFDLTCRDKVATIGGSNRVNNDRRMDIFREPDGESTWSHFTVSGKACRTGSACEKNFVTGFYSCEIDGDEIGAWDYCCKSDYPCGYSQGFDYPWCFVGEGSDQWRTCSDRYYPVSSSNSISHVTTSNDSANNGSNINKKKVSPISYTMNKRKNDTYHQPPPRPGGLQNLEDIASARLWPVTYLYSSGPPNATDLSNFVDCNKENC